MKIVWSAQASTDLLGIVDYIARDDTVAARRVEKKVQASVNLLHETPHIGRQGRIDGTRELSVTRTSYIVPYKIAGNKIRILRVYHMARLWPEQFEE